MAKRHPTPLRRAAATVPVRADGVARLVVVADTHSYPHPGSLAHIEALAPDGNVHAGDIGDLSVLDQLAAIAPLYVVRGNIDGRSPDLPDALKIDLLRGQTLLMRLLVLHIAVNGPKLRNDAAVLAREAGANVIICGHSHVPFIGRDRGFVVFNPGSVGPRRFSLPIVFGTLDVRPDGARFAHVDAETGAAWTPG